MKTKSSKMLLVKKLKEPSFAKIYEEAGYLLSVGVSIARARERLGLSQGKLARKLKTTQSVISRIENGNQNLSLKMLIKIACILHCELSVNITPTKMAA